MKVIIKHSPDWRRKHAIETGEDVAETTTIDVDTRQLSVDCRRLIYSETGYPEFITIEDKIYETTSPEISDIDAAICRRYAQIERDRKKALRLKRDNLTRTWLVEQLHAIIVGVTTKGGRHNTRNIITAVQEILDQATETLEEIGQQQ